MRAICNRCRLLFRITTARTAAYSLREKMVLDLSKREKVLCCVSIFRRVCYVDGYEFRWQV